MSNARVTGLFLQQLYLTRRHLEIWFDLIVFAAMNMILFGFIFRYVSDEGSSAAGGHILLGILMFDIIRINQYRVSINSLWSMWSHNLSNIFIAPISMLEYLFVDCASALVSALSIFGLLSGLAWVTFDFNVLDIGVVTLVAAIVNLSIFAWALGFVLLGLVFRYGTRIQSITWGVIFLFQPLTAAFFPVSVLPDPLEVVAWLFPPTYVFEAARDGMAGEATQWNLLAASAALNVAYFVAGVSALLALFHRSRVVGQFARNDL